MERTQSSRTDQRTEVPKGLLAKSLGKTLLDRGDVGRPKPVEHAIPQSGPNTEEAVLRAEAKRKNEEIKRKISSFETDAQNFERFLAYYFPAKGRLEQTRAHVEAELRRHTAWWNLFPNVWQIEHLKEKIASIDQDLANLEQSKTDKEWYLKTTYQEMAEDPVGKALTLPFDLAEHREAKRQEKRRRTGGRPS